MKQIIFFISALMYTNSSYALKICYDGPTILQTQQEINEDMVKKYGTIYDYANIKCREENCFRATGLTTKTHATNQYVAPTKTITSVTCTKKRADLNVLSTSPWSNSNLNASFHKLKRRGKLPKIDLGQHNKNSKSGNTKTSATPPPSKYNSIDEILEADQAGALDGE